MSIQFLQQWQTARNLGCGPPRTTVDFREQNVFKPYHHKQTGSPIVGPPQTQSSPGNTRMRVSLCVCTLLASEYLLGKLHAIESMRLATATPKRPWEENTRRRVSLSVCTLLASEYLFEKFARDSKHAARGYGRQITKKGRTPAAIHIALRGGVGRLDEFRATTRPWCKFQFEPESMPVVTLRHSQS